MSVALFLAGRDLRRRIGRVVLAAAVVAGAVTLSAGLELLARSRERAVEAQLDAAGPALRVLPSPVSAGEAAALRFGGQVLPGGAEGRARAALRGSARIVEPRLVVEDRDARIAVVGADPGSPAAPREVTSLPPGTVALGAELAARSGRRPGDAVVLLGRELAVGGILPANADAGDLAAHVPLPELRRLVGRGDASELRVFLEPGAAAADAERALRAALPDVAVLRADRGAVAERDLQGALASHRRAVQLVTGLVAAIALLIASHLDAGERRRELALLGAIGVTTPGLAMLLVARAVASGIAGAIAGGAIAVAIAASQPAFSASAVPSIMAVATLVAALVAGVAAAPVAVAAARRDPVAQLQES